MNRTSTLLAFVITAAPLVSYSQEWAPRMDLLTAGAAASVVLHQACAGDSAAQRAMESASNRLLTEANSTSAPADAYGYARSAYALKAKAMWQSNAGISCTGMQRLREIASGTGFNLPTGN